MTLFGHTITLDNHDRPSRSERSQTGSQMLTMDEVRPGSKVTIEAFASGLSAERRAHLQSYGLVPGRCARVLQHSPVTVVEVEHCELALEAGLARLIQVSV